LFGTRKIFAKVMNHKLVVRIGGGYMSFTEFIETHALIELKKINELEANGNWDLEQFVAQMRAGHGPDLGRASSHVDLGKRKSSVGARPSPTAQRRLTMQE
jgi:hypothetical protein